MTDAKELLACPFCGPGNSKVSSWFDDMSKRWAVSCGRCEASSGRSVHAKGSKEAAIKSWNTRALPSPDNPSREELISGIGHSLAGHSFALIHGGHHEEVASKIVGSILARLPANPPDPDSMNDKRAREARLTQIIIDLFVPDSGHKDGCLTKTGGPCQCGWSDTQIRYNAALKAAKQIASQHDYTKDFRKPVLSPPSPGERK